MSNRRGLPPRLAVIFCALLCCDRIPALPAEPPLAEDADIDFRVEYSTDKLMLGDILFAQITIKNAADHAVRVSSFHPLTIRAKSSNATQLAWGFGELPGGTRLLELAAGQEIVFEVALDMFGDDGREDGTFDPFDSDLENQKVSLHATCSTVMPHRRKNSDYRDFLLKDSQMIEFGRPLISRREFGEAVARMLESEGIEIADTYLSVNQSSYLFTKSDVSRRRWAADRRTGDAILRVLSQRLPQASTTRRAAAITVATSRFLGAESLSAEEKAMSDIIFLLAQGSRVERSYWESELLDALTSERMQRIGVVPERKATVLSSRLRGTPGN